MSNQSMHSCTKHSHEHAADICRRCAMPWCADCLVYTYGPSKPPYCISCAMVAAGVRTHATLPAASRKQLKAQRKARKQAEKEQRKQAAPAAVQEQPADADAARSDLPADEAVTTWPAEADWKTPWWEVAERDNPAPVD